MQTKQGKVDLVKALDASLVYLESSGTVSNKQNDNSSSGDETSSSSGNKSSVYENGNTSSENKSSKLGIESRLGNESSNSGNDTDVDSADIRPTYDTDSLEKVPLNDDYNVFATNGQRIEQLESINHTYVMEKIDSNITFDSSDMSYNEGKVDQHDAQHKEERSLLASLIEK
nr:hypothetical protein [Tanacetum cinerariifolium]